LFLVSTVDVRCRTETITVHCARYLAELQSVYLSVAPTVSDYDHWKVKDLSVTHSNERFRFICSVNVSASVAQEHCSGKLQSNVIWSHLCGSANVFIMGD